MTAEIKDFPIIPRPNVRSSELMAKASLMLADANFSGFIGHAVAVEGAHDLIVLLDRFEARMRDARLMLEAQELKQKVPLP